jgi:hypothetical protein
MDDVLTLGILAVAGFAIYELLKSMPGTSPSDNPANYDPTTGAYNGPINAADNALVPQVYPGGGEVAGSAETYTGAAEESLFHPLCTAQTILGVNQTTCAPFYLWDLSNIIGMVP